MLLTFGGDHATRKKSFFCVHPPTSGRKGCWKYESESLEQRKNDPIFRG